MWNDTFPVHLDVNTINELATLKSCGLLNKNEVAEDLADAIVDSEED